MSEVTLTKAANVAASSTVTADWTPGAGESVKILSFAPSGSIDQKGVALLYWDYGGAGEALLWSSYGDTPVHGDAFWGPFSGDGVKKFAIVLKNDSLFSVFLSGTAHFNVES